MTPYLSGLRQDLAAAAQAGDEDTRRSAEVLAAAIEPAARLTLMHALSDLAAEVTSKLPDHTVDVRLDGRELRTVVTPHVAAEAQPEPEAAPHATQSGGSTGQTGADASGDISRITLRLMEEMKAKAEQAAASQGVSLNSFVANAVQGALGAHRRPGQDGGSSMQGWAQW